MKSKYEPKSEMPRPRERLAVFKLPPELKETVLRLAEIRYEEKRLHPGPGQNEDYFKKMKNRLICDYCDDICRDNDIDSLKKLSRNKEAQLKQLQKLRNQSSPKENPGEERPRPQRHSLYDPRPLTHFEPVTEVAHTTEELQKAFQKLLDR